MIISTRKSAKLRDDKQYYTGKFCRNNHLDVRDTKTGKCKQCCKEANHRSYIRNFEKIKETQHTWVKNNPEKVKEIKRKYVLNNPERRVSSCKKWSSENRGSCNANLARYKARKKNAEPAWLSETQRLEIANFYKIAKWYDVQMHVDHIVPLRGNNVCGLHVHWNLQLLPANINKAKGNKHE